MTIFINDPIQQPPLAEIQPGWIDHVNCNGARWHVLTYSTDGIKCSEPNCIVNKEQVVKRRN